MTKNKIDYGNYIPSGGVMLSESILLAIHYGFDKQLPFLVLWFPLIYSFGILAVVLFIVFLVFIGSIISGN